MLSRTCCAYHTTSGTMHPVPISRERCGGNSNKPAYIQDHSAWSLS